MAVRELNVFERHLPHEVADLVVGVPPGLKYVCSPRLSGVKSPMKRYHVQVEPNARNLCWKEQVRLQAKQPPEPNTEYVAASAADTDERVIRSTFRHLRVPYFQAQSHFPALLSPRLVPTWDTVNPKSQESSQMESLTAEADSMSLSPRRNRRVVRLAMPTVSILRKQRSKVEATDQAWHVCGVAGAHELVSDRKYALHEDAYIQRKDPGMRQDVKELWLAPCTILPTCPAEAKLALDRSHGPAAVTEVAREKGREMKEALQARYLERRLRYKTAVDYRLQQEEEHKRRKAELEQQERNRKAVTQVTVVEEPRPKEHAFGGPLLLRAATSGRLD